MQEPIEPDTGITEATRQTMFAFIDDLVRPNHVAKPVNTHVYHVIGELEALDLQPGLNHILSTYKGIKGIVQFPPFCD